MPVLFQERVQLLKGRFPIQIPSDLVFGRSKVEVFPASRVVADVTLHFPDHLRAKAQVGSELQRHRLIGRRGWGWMRHGLPPHES